MQIKLLTLNVQGRMNLDKIFPLFEKEQPDILCLQEVFLEDLEYMKDKYGYNFSFGASNNMLPDGLYQFGEAGLQGSAIVSKHEIESKETYFYRGEGNAPLYTGFLTPDKVVVIGVVKGIKIATTHFTLSRKGQFTVQQYTDFVNLMKQINHNEKLILCGDFNSPRGGQMFSLFEEQFKDNLPKNVESTIDPNLHRVKGLSLAVDTIFSRGYTVKDVRVIEGVSDHKCIIGMVTLPS